MENKIRQDLAIILNETYKLMAKRYQEIQQNTHFVPSLARDTIEAYMQARELLMKRDKISGNLQWHKIAGLMASAVVKTRPIQLVPEHVDSKGFRLSRDNEAFAVLQGLAICASAKSNQEIGIVLKLPHFTKWFVDFVHHLHENPSNSDGFIQIFETLSLTYFSANLAGGK